MSTGQVSTGQAVAAAVVGELVNAGIDTIFGLPGGGPNLDVIGAADAAGMRFVLTHTETAGCIAAGTYGLLRGQVGAALCTRGPGLTSAVNGLAQAQLDRFPLVLLADTVPSVQRSKVPHQRIDQTALTAAVTKWSATVGSNEPAAVTRAAVALAAAGPAGAVHLDIDPTALGDEPRPPAVVRIPVAVAELDRARALISASRRPAVIVGVGVSGAVDELRSFVAALRAPALPTYQGVGSVSGTDVWTGPLFTNGRSEQALLSQADLIVTVGLDPVEPIAAAWAYGVAVLSVAETAMVGTPTEPTVELVGPLARLLAELAMAASGESDWPHGVGAAARRDVIGALQSGAVAGGFDPFAATDVLRRSLRPGTITTVDAGAHFLAVMPTWEPQQPHELLISNGLATMGFAIPAAIGAALARPGQPVLAITGDGGAGIVLAELETIVRLGLDITVVVFNDSALSLIEIKQGASHGGHAAVRFAPTDFAAIAAGFGLAGCVVRTSNELGEAALGSGPQLIDARIDPSIYSHALRVTRG